MWDSLNCHEPSPSHHHFYDCKILTISIHARFMAARVDYIRDAKNLLTESRAWPQLGWHAIIFDVFFSFVNFAYFSQSLSEKQFIFAQQEIPILSPENHPMSCYISYIRWVSHDLPWYAHGSLSAVRWSLSWGGKLGVEFAEPLFQQCAVCGINQE